MTHSRHKAVVDGFELTMHEHVLEMALWHESGKYHCQADAGRRRRDLHPSQLLYCLFVWLAAIR